MRTLFILLPILLFLLLLLLAPIRFSLSYDGRICCAVHYLPFRISIYPRKRRKRKKAKRRRKDKHLLQKKSRKGSAKKEKPPIRISDIRLLLRLFTDVLGDFLSKASRHVRIRVRRLYLSVGGADDAARAAIEYGILTQATSYFFAFLEESGFLRPPKPKDVTLEVNFLESGHTFALHTTVECPLIFLIPLLFRTFCKALTAKNTWTTHRARAKARKKKKLQTKENGNG